MYYTISLRYDQNGEPIPFTALRNDVVFDPKMLLDYEKEEVEPDFPVLPLINESCLLRDYVQGMLYAM
jgi:hypothetical protein